MVSLLGCALFAVSPALHGYLKLAAGLGLGSPVGEVPSMFSVQGIFGSRDALGPPETWSFGTKTIAVFLIFVTIAQIIGLVSLAIVAMHYYSFVGASKALKGRADALVHAATDAATAAVGSAALSLTSAAEDVLKRGEDLVDSASAAANSLVGSSSSAEALVAKIDYHCGKPKGCFGNNVLGPINYFGGIVLAPLTAFYLSYTYMYENPALPPGFFYAVGASSFWALVHFVLNLHIIIAWKEDFFKAAKALAGNAADKAK